MGSGAWWGHCPLPFRSGGNGGISALESTIAVTHNCENISLHRNKFTFQRRKTSKNDQISCENCAILLLLQRFNKFRCCYPVYSAKMPWKVRIVEVSPEHFSPKGYDGGINALSFKSHVPTRFILPPQPFHRSGVSGENCYSAS